MKPYHPLAIDRKAATARRAAALETRRQNLAEKIDKETHPSRGCDLTFGDLKQRRLAEKNKRRAKAGLPPLTSYADL